MPASDWERAQRRLEREQKAADRAARDRYLAHRASSVDQQNAELQARLHSLTSILVDGLQRRPGLDFARLREGKPLVLGDLSKPLPAPSWEVFEPKKLSAVSQIFGGGSRYQKRLETARDDYQRAMDQHARTETERQQRVAGARRRHEQELSPRREKYTRLQQSWHAQEKQGVEEYLQQVLSGMRLPKWLETEVAVAFDPRVRGAVVQLQLPRRDVVPKQRGFAYVKLKDEVREQPRPAKEVAALYRSLISQIALLCLRDCIKADGRLESVGFNGHLRTIDPRTGQSINPCLLSLSVERARFEELLLDRVSPDACLQHLNALVSPHPLELEPIRPILNFDATKYVFVEGMDAASGLDARPILTELTPTEFEHLVRQLCEAMGLQSWTTRQSNDDGVDAVAFSPDPMIGGESIVQAKRYTKAIGPQHIRELSGAMEEKKASRGILITTSWLTERAIQKARDHNRISWIDGQNLVSLIKEHLGKDVLAGAVPPRPRTNDKP